MMKKWGDNKRRGSTVKYGVTPFEGGELVKIPVNIWCSEAPANSTKFKLGLGRGKC